MKTITLNTTKGVCVEFFVVNREIVIAPSTTVDDETARGMICAMFPGWALTAMNTEPEADA